MRIKLDYGRTGLQVELPDDRVVGPLEIKTVPPLADPAAVIRQTLQRPLGTAPLAELAQGRDNACILVSDFTRPVPNEALLTPLLKTLIQAGIPRQKILLLIATGLHRPNEGAELVEMLGASIAADYRIENHHGTALDEHTCLGTTDNGVPMWIDTRYLEADLKITTGLIEPHLMAGYSGGRKLICPGIAALETIKVWHGPRFLEDPRADCGIVEGNPVHEENTRIALRAGCDFIANVCVDRARRIMHVVAGDMIQAWEAGVQFVEPIVRTPIPKPVDVVLTSAAGYPLDTTWYQSIKGLTGALPIVKQGGTIILVASMTEGFGSADFQQCVREAGSPEEFVRKLQHTDYFRVDQWQLEELCKVLRRAKVKVYGDDPPAGLSDSFVEPIDNVEQAVEASLSEYGPEAKIAVIPKGPYVLPCVA